MATEKRFSIYTELKNAEVARSQAAALDKEIVKLGTDTIKVGNTTSTATREFANFGQANTALTAPVRQVATGLNQQSQVLPKTVTNVKELTGALSGNKTSYEQLRGPADLYTKSITGMEGKSTSVTGKLKGFGSQLQSNVGSLTAVTGSSWALFNAVDNLEKKQLAATKSNLAVETAQLKVSKAQELLTKLTDEGKTGTLDYTQAQDALKIAQEKLAIATERNSIVQGDLQEDYANLATQILPLVMATGGSVTQLFQNLGKEGGLMSGTFGKIKTGATSLAGSLTGIGSAAKGAMGSVSGLITTLGPIALIIAGITAAYWLWTRAMEAQEQFASKMKVANQIKDTNERIKETNQLIDEQLDKPFGEGWAESVGNFIVKIGPAGLGIKFAGTQLKELNRIAQLSKDIDGQLVLVREQLSAATDKYNDAVASRTTVDDAGALATKTYWENEEKRLLQLQKSPAMTMVGTVTQEEYNKMIAEGGGITKEYSDILLKVGGVKNLDVQTSEAMSTAQKNVNDKFATFADIFPNGMEQAKASLADFIKEQEKWIKLTMDADVLLSKHNVENAEFEDQQRIINQVFGEGIDIKSLDYDVITQLVDIGKEQLTGYKKEELALVAIAAQQKIYIPNLKEILKNEKDDTAVLNALILARQKDVTFVKSQIENQKLLSQGQQQGTQAANDWYRQLVVNTEAGKNEEMQIRAIAEALLRENHPALQMNIEDLKLFIEELIDTEGALKKMKDTLKTELGKGFSIIDKDSFKEAKKSIKEFLKDIHLGKETESIIKVGMEVDAKTVQAIKKEVTQELTGLALAIKFKVNEEDFEKSIGSVIGRLQKELSKGAKVQPIIDLLQKIKDSEKPTDAFVQSLSQLTGMSAEAIFTDTDGLVKALQSADPKVLNDIASGITAGGTAAEGAKTPLNEFETQIVDIQDLNKVMNTHYIEGLNAMGNKTEEFRNFAGTRMKAITDQTVNNMQEMNKSMNTHFIAGLNASGNKTEQFKNVATKNFEATKKGAVDDIVAINKSLNSHFIGGLNAAGNKTGQFKDVATKNFNATGKAARNLISDIDELANELADLDGTKSTVTIETIKLTKLNTCTNCDKGGEFFASGLGTGSFIADKAMNIQGHDIALNGRPELVTVTPLTGNVGPLKASIASPNNPLDTQKTITVKGGGSQNLSGIANSIIRAIQSQNILVNNNNNLYLDGRQVYNSMRPHQVRSLSSIL